MTFYDFTNFNGDLQNWVNNRFINSIPFVEGGWEYWIQIDFVAWADNQYGKQFDFRREVVVLPDIRLACK